MKSLPTISGRIVTLFAIPILLLLGLSCGQYEYTSPNPGIVEIRLRVKNSRTDILPFGQNSKFNIVIRDLFLQRSDSARLEVLQDLEAIRRSTDGDSLNCLSVAARDSQLIIGKAYAPPGTYVGLRGNSVITHDPFVVVYTIPQVPNLIPVLNITGDNFFQVVGNAPNITVSENKLTLITLTLDLDLSLVRRTSWFDWPAPYAYISSIQIL